MSLFSLFFSLLCYHTVVETTISKIAVSYCFVVVWCLIAILFVCHKQSSMTILHYVHDCSCPFFHYWQFFHYCYCHAYCHSYCHCYCHCYCYCSLLLLLFIVIVVIIDIVLVHFYCHVNCARQYQRRTTLTV